MLELKPDHRLQSDALDRLDNDDEMLRELLALFQEHSQAMLGSVPYSGMTGSVWSGKNWYTIL